MMTAVTNETVHEICCTYGISIIPMAIRIVLYLTLDASIIRCPETSITTALYFGMFDIWNHRQKEAFNFSKIVPINFNNFAL